mgnify:CR=1 FL=1
MVLGCALEASSSDGDEQWSCPVLLQRRCDTALELYLARKKSCLEEDRLPPLLLLCGGIPGVQLLSSKPSEARAMLEYLCCARGEDMSHVDCVLEEQSVNTVENALFARALLVQTQCSSVHVVTSALHEERAGIIFRKLFQVLFSRSCRMLDCSRSSCVFFV